MIGALDVSRPKRIALYASLLGLSLPSAAIASGDPDSLVKIAPRPPGSDLIAVASMNGGNALIYSRDGGESFSAMCARIASAEVETSRGLETVHLTSFETLLVTHDDHVLVGTPYGLWIDDGKGCGWELVPEVRTFVSSLVHDPIDPQIVYGATETGGGADNGVFRRNADGTFDIVGELAPFAIHSLKVVELPDGGRRFYKLFRHEQALFNEAGERVDLAEGETPSPDLRLRYLSLFTIAYSDDDGETWTEHPLDVDLEGGSFEIEAVDPTNPDRLVISIRRFADAGTPDLVRISEDRGETLRDWHTVFSVAAVTFAPDGQLWIADAGEGSVDKTRGLWHASSTNDEPELITDAYAANCAEWRDGKLEVCTLDRYGVADLETGEIEPTFTSSTIDAVHVCEDVDVVKMCESSFCRTRCVHWHQAPMCVDSYHATGEMCSSSSPTGTGGSTASGGSSSEGTGGMMSGDPPEPTADDGGVMPSARNDGGCSCRAAGGADQQRGAGLIASALLLFLIAARRISRGSTRRLCSSFGRAR